MIIPNTTFHIKKILIPDHWHYIITFINMIIMFNEEIFILNNNIKSINYLYLNYESAKSEIYVISRYICIHCFYISLYCLLY